MKISIFLEDEDNGIILKSFENQSFEMAEDNLWKLQRGYVAELKRLDDELEEDKLYTESAERDKQNFFDSSRGCESLKKNL